MQDSIENWANDLNSKGTSITIQVSNTQNSAPRGTIIHQNKSNLIIGIKATVIITVSSGKMVFVPDFIIPAGATYDSAMTRERATALCQEINIIPLFVEAVKADRLPGEIWSQSIDGGKEISEGSTITLKYAPANVQITVPDFTNMTKTEIREGNFDKMLQIQFIEDVAPPEGLDSKVLDQSVIAGTRVGAGSHIVLTLDFDIQSTVD